MEKKGAVNQYVPHAAGRLMPNPRGSGVYLDRSPQPTGDPVFTLNLAAGVTPFIKEFHDREYASQCYRLTAPPVVTHAWYRPNRDEFELLDPWSREHVLNGGLLCEELALASRRQMTIDPVTPEWDYEQFQAWCLEHYGQRRPPMDAPTKK